MNSNEGEAGGAGGGEGFGGAGDLIGGGTGGETGGGTGGGGEAGTGGEKGAGSEDKGGQDPDWYASVSSDVPEGKTASNRDWLASKGISELDQLIGNYREAENKIRNGGGLDLPGDDATDDQIAEFHKAIGVPEGPDGYTIPEPKDADGNPIELETKVLERVTEFAHKHGVPAKALNSVLEEMVNADIADMDEAREALKKAAGDHVKGWGEEREDKVRQVDAAAKDLGLTSKDMEYLRGLPSGPGKSLDMLAKMGANFTEDRLISGDKKTFGMTAESAKAEIAAIQADPKAREQAMIPGTPENKRYNRANDALAAAADKAQER